MKFLTPDAKNGVPTGHKQFVGTAFWPSGAETTMTTLLCTRTCIILPQINNLIAKIIQCCCANRNGFAVENTLVDDGSNTIWTL